MVARPGRYQTSFNAGELAPELAGATGLKQFHAGALRMENVEPVPQSGFRLAPRTRLVGEARRPMQAVFISPLTVTLVQSIGTGPFFDTGAVRQIAAVEIAVFSGDSAVTQRRLAVQALDTVDNVWKTIGGAYVVPTAASPATRRAARPPRDPISARYVRVVAIETLDIAIDLTITSVSVFEETAGDAPAHRWAHLTREDGLAYVAILTAFNVDLWRDGVFVGAVGSGIPEADLADLCLLPSDDTLLLFHRNHAPRRLLWRGADHDWSYDLLPFTRIPQVRYDGVYVDAAEVWYLYFRWPTSGFTIGGGATFTVSVDGDAALPQIVVDGGGGVPDWTVTAGNLQAALLLLPGVETGLTVAPGITGAGYAELIVTFAGGNAGQNFDVSGRIVSSTEAALSSERHTRGEMGGEDIMSTARGWPACAAFYQGRLVMGGFRSKPTAVLFSRPNEYFDLNTELAAANAAMLIAIDAGADERVLHMAQARHLVIFTNAAHYYVADRAVSATAAPNVVKSERGGVAATIAPLEQDDVLLAVNGERSALLAISYDDVRQGYAGEPISLLSSHLLRGVAAMALQVRSAETDANRVWMVRDDGLIVVAHLLRGQEVGAFVRWSTDGLARGVVVDGANRVFLTIDRAVGAGDRRLFIERVDPAAMFDGEVSYTFAAPGTIIGGLGAHEGRPVWAFAEGYAVGPLTVANGFAALPWLASGTVTAGRWSPPVVETLSPPRDVAERVVLRRPARIHTARLDVLDTTSLAVGANGGPARNQPLARFGDPAALPTPPRSGEIVATGLTGFADAPTLTITQTRPGRLQVRAVTLEARL